VVSIVMSTDFDRIDPGFVSDLVRSGIAVQRAAQWLSSCGYPVVVRPTFIRPDQSQMNDFSDDGDLEIMQRIEVKRRGGVAANFTGPHDFPFSTVIVDVCHAYDKARPKPYAYIIFNEPMTCAIVIACKATRAAWVRAERADKGRVRAFYECPLDLVRFEAFSAAGAKPV
jgi:hypothetical protein